LLAKEFELRFTEDMRLLSDDMSRILGIGVEFGNIGFDAKPIGVKYAGCGKGSRKSVVKSVVSSIKESTNSVL